MIKENQDMQHPTLMDLCPNEEKNIFLAIWKKKKSNTHSAENPIQLIFLRAYL